MKRLLLLCLIATIGATVYADAYRDSLQEVLRYSESQYLTAKQTMIMAPKLGEKWGKNLTTAYGQFMMSDSRRKMILDMYEPACRARLSESEVLVLLQRLRTSKVIGLTSDKDKLVKSMRDESISIFILDNREKWKKVPAKAAKGKTVFFSYNLLLRILGSIRQNALKMQRNDL